LPEASISAPWNSGVIQGLALARSIAAAVDPAQPFVRNEELTVKTYETGDPGDLLQESTYGDTARDYRIDSVGELYIANFQTLRQPRNYTVKVWRKDFLVGSFTFATVK